MGKDKKDVVAPHEKLGITTCSMGEIPNVLDLAWAMDRKMTVCLIGETGIGKTPIVHQWSKNREGLPDGFTYVLNFGHMTQEEISMIMFNEDATSFGFVPPKFLLELNEKAEKLGRAVLFLDEWNRGDKALVNALFTLTDERRIHNFELHENVLIVAAMNPSDGTYLVNEAEKDHAIRKRLNFIYVNPDEVTWLKYAKTEGGFHPLVPMFIEASSAYFYDSGARDAGRAFPCPSNWEKVSNICKSADTLKRAYNSPAVRALIVGQIGKVAGDKFIQFAMDQNTLIHPNDILESYTQDAPVRKKVAKMIAHKIDKDTKELVPLQRGNARMAIMTELTGSLAVNLFVDQPSPEKIAPHLALFIGDLPNELITNFAGHQLFENAQKNGEEGKAYLRKLSQALHKHKPYRARIKEITEAINSYKKKAGMSGQAKDPME